MNSNRLNQLEIQHLSAFLAIYNTRNTAKAADKLGLSQQAVSRIIKKLRDATGDQLFIKTQSGFESTCVADKLAQQLPSALDGLLSTFDVEESFSPDSITGEIRIALHHSALELIASDLYSIFRNQAPNAKLRVDHCDLGTFEGVLSGSIHLALNHEHISHSKELYVKSILDDEPHFYTNKQHPLAGKVCDVTDVDEYDLISCVGTEIEEGMRIKTLTESLTNKEFNIGLRCGDLNTAKKVVMNSNSILVGSKMYAGCYPDELVVLNLPLPSLIKVSFSSFVLQKNRNNPLYVWLNEVVQELIHSKMQGTKFANHSVA